MQRFPTVGGVSIPELLEGYARMRGLKRIELARELGVSRSIVTQWMQGMQPGIKSCQRIAERTGIPLEALLEAAHHVVPTLPQDVQYPGWLTEYLDKLTPIEMTVLAETARGLLRLRGETVPTGEESR